MLVISRQPPTALAAREALDLALAAAAFGVPVSMLFMDAGEIIEENDPESFFTAPKNPRTRSFLDQVLTH